MNAPGRQFRLPVRDYDLAATLGCGQAFRWRPADDGWEGVVAGRWVRLVAEGEELAVTLAEDVSEIGWLENHLQTRVNLAAVLASFPDDEPMRAAVAQCPGLRLLRQEPWECLASFILSSTKQIVQIRQIVELLCRRFGEPVAVPDGHAPAFAFPTAERLARCTEAELRACKMGFRAPYLRETAKLVARGDLDLGKLATLDCESARAGLMRCPGVGQKVADCVLLFAYGFQSAFPVDVWVLKALRKLYFPRRRPTAKRLLKFTATHFGQNAGYAQQYLFHYMRLQAGRAERAEETSSSRVFVIGCQCHAVKSLEVLFTPAEFAALAGRDLSETVCVVFDVLRATTTMLTALHHGAEAIIPVGTIPDALAVRERMPGVLLAGERDGRRIAGALSGGVEFDLGNSPREFTRAKVRGRTIVMTTTNGTRALRACAQAKQVLLGGFVNLSALARAVVAAGAVDVKIICSGTGASAASEDTLGAGALCDALSVQSKSAQVADSAEIARQIFTRHASGLLAAMQHACNGRRLLALPELAADVPVCLAIDTVPFAAELGRDGSVRKLSDDALTAGCPAPRRVSLGVK